MLEWSSRSLATNTGWNLLLTGPSKSLSVQKAAKFCLPACPLSSTPICSQHAERVAFTRTMKYAFSRHILDQVYVLISKGLGQFLGQLKKDLFDSQLWPQLCIFHPDFWPILWLPRSYHLICILFFTTLIMLVSKAIRMIESCRISMRLGKSCVSL